VRLGPIEPPAKTAWSCGGDARVEPLVVARSSLGQQRLALGEDDRDGHAAEDRVAV
jgi:hypothetical protein